MRTDGHADARAARQREAQQPHVGVRFDVLLRRLRTMSWDDRELEYVGVWGADDECAGRPWHLCHRMAAGRGGELARFAGHGDE